MNEHVSSPVCVACNLGLWLSPDSCVLLRVAGRAEDDLARAARSVLADSCWGDHSGLDKGPESTVLAAFSRSPRQLSDVLLRPGVLPALMAPLTSTADAASQDPDLLNDAMIVAAALLRAGCVEPLAEYAG